MNPRASAVATGVQALSCFSDLAGGLVDSVEGVEGVVAALSAGLLSLGLALEVRV
jgi:hypothetical protein